MDENRVSRSGLSRTSLLTLLAISGAVFLLLHVASDHTAQSQRFAARPEFGVWAWAYVAYGAAATTVGFSTFPSYQLLTRAEGRRATAWSVVFWAIAAALLSSFNPGILSAHSPLWLQTERVTTANLICGVFAIPSFAGLFLVNVRLSTLRREMRATVAEGRAGTVIGQLLWLRATLQRFLVSLAILISVGVLASGALRSALLADGVPADAIPIANLFTYGGFYAGLAALIFVPIYIAWQGAAVALREMLYPIPDTGLTPHDWHQGRGDFDSLLSVRTSAGSLFTAAFGILAPLASGLVTALTGTH